jgi:undecaprenyl-diphosphatase
MPSTSDGWQHVQPRREEAAVDLFEAILLGVVQGATEFIPVSSSGHLVIVPWLAGWQKPSLLFDTVLHWGTLLSILLVFWRDFWLIGVATLQSLWRRSLADVHARLGWFIVFGSVPAAVLGLLLKDYVEQLFHSPLSVGFFLFVTAALLVGSEQLAARQKGGQDLPALKAGGALSIGLAQAIALAPGISRSGSTIAVGLVVGLRRDAAARFSFLLGTPAFLGAGMLALRDALASDPAEVAALGPALVAGFLASAVVGVLAIRFLIHYLRTRSLYLFAAYCVAAGLFVIVLSFYVPQ